MEKSEPALVPEWLRSSGSVTGGGNSAHLFASSSSSHSDGSSFSHQARNRNSKSTSDFDNPRSSFLSNSRRSSSNGSNKHAYSSFSRSHRDKDREREKERLSFTDHWDRDSTDPLGSPLASRVEKGILRRSQSMISRKQGDLLPRRSVLDVKTMGNSSHSNGNGVLAGGSIGSSIQKAVFEKDFPSLGTEERQGVPDIGRVPSPGLTTAVQSLPVGNSALIGGEGWTSALAEVPSIIGSSSSGSLSVLQTVTAPSGSGSSSASAGLNMAETLVQAPTRAQTAPQMSVNTQRREELAIKQSRQLIPVTPSISKASVLGSSDKSKPKVAVRTGEMAAKSVQQQPNSLHHANQSVLGGHVKSDVPKTSHGKLFVLKSTRENGVLPTLKDVPSPTNSANIRAANSQPSVVPSPVSAPLKSSNNSVISSGERKAVALNPISGFSVEKRPSFSQTQSRHDFFNHLKKKTSMNPPAVVPDSGAAVSPTSMENSGEVTKEAVSAPVSPHCVENGAEVTSNGDSPEVVQGFSDDRVKNISPSAKVYSIEEEVAFLRSLGWDENAGEDEGLTEEEISAFYQEVMKLRPSLKFCQGLQSKPKPKSSDC